MCLTSEIQTPITPLFMNENIKCELLRTRENSDVFNSLDEIYLVFTSKKQMSSIYFIIISSPEPKAQR